MNVFPAEETTDPVYADDRNFFKVELWDKAELRIERMLYAGDDIHKARQTFDDFVRKRPRGHVTIRQRIRVLRKHPEH